MGKITKEELERVEIMMRLSSKLTLTQWKNIECAFVPKNLKKTENEQQQRNTVLSGRHRNL